MIIVITPTLLLTLLKYCHSLLSKDNCTLNNGEYVKTGLAELERWYGQATEEVL